MILAAGLSPAWQQVMRFDAFHPGEVNRAAEVIWYGSGKTLNVGIALTRLGADCRVISPLGGAARDFIEGEFDELGISARWIGTASSTRICTTILDGSSGVTTELVENARPMAADELAEFTREYTVHITHSKFAVLSGSLAAGAPPTFFRELLRGTHCPAILDVRGPELFEALNERPLVVKPNRHELSQTLNRALDDDMSLLFAMHELCERGAQWVVVTDGPRPVLVASREGNFCLTPPPIEKLVNPIGSGDSLAAGIAFSLSQGRGMLDAIRFGLGAAADNVGQLLAARIDAGRAAKLAEDVETETVV